MSEVVVRRCLQVIFSFGRTNDPFDAIVQLLQHQNHFEVPQPVAPVVQFVISKPSDVGTRVRISVLSHELGFFVTIDKK